MRIQLKQAALLAALAAMAITAAQADRLSLVNGDVVDGTFLGGDTRQVRFLVADGSSKSYSIDDIAGIEFGTSAPAVPAATAAPATPAASAAPAPATAPRAAAAPAAPAASAAAPSVTTVPSGIEIIVRMIDSIDSKTTGPGERFRASIDDPVVVDNEVLIPRGADASVQIMAAEEGKELSLKLYDVTVDGKTYDAVSDYAQLEGESRKGKTVKRAAILGAIGAGIGAVAGGGKGAAIGAGAGAGAGAASVALSGRELRVPSETRLAFMLRAPLPLD